MTGSRGADRFLRHLDDLAAALVVACKTPTQLGRRAGIVHAGLRLKDGTVIKTLCGVNSMGTTSFLFEIPDVAVTCARCLTKRSTR